MFRLGLLRGSLIVEHVADVVHVLCLDALRAHIALAPPSACHGVAPLARSIWKVANLADHVDGIHALLALAPPGGQGCRVYFGTPFFDSLHTFKSRARVYLDGSHIL